MSERIEKYEKKLDAEVRGKLYDAQKDFMVEQERVYFQDAEKLERWVKRVVSGEPSMYHHFYIAFAEEVAKLAKKHKGQTLTTELEIIEGKWAIRGLNSDLLDEIKLHYVQAYPYANVFKLDFSYLDGTDVLS